MRAYILRYIISIINDKTLNYRLRYNINEQHDY
jgi:hypothetical protein